MAPESAGWEWGELNETMAYAYTSVRESDVPPALAVNPNSSAPPHMSMAPFVLLS